MTDYDQADKGEKKGITKISGDYKNATLIHTPYHLTDHEQRLLLLEPIRRPELTVYSILICDFTNYLMPLKLQHYAQ